MAESLGAGALEAISSILPGIERSCIDTVDAGIIFCWGSSDIDDPNSELHERHDIGVTARDGYFSINTGKFTCAPLFAQDLIEAISGRKTH
jgi:hypothetical protein